ncbi:hypothetical protein SAMN04488550_0598 [Gordonia malaquae]|uniref:MPT63-like domain-containing protein n=1 Tax=Gordonia malaquae NBRC 108250 TaxID=1223542 RepID=M3VGE3_GORML|nr:hypothetical protein [Gordonia malaquae]GAC80839.1 hypothetical protein GM1_022_00500 [Gordonia malaquae NBRC 108250]SEB67547.1 hypothetical protein SAMN04488550_0598 [Gordonia malaquae]
MTTITKIRTRVAAAAGGAAIAAAALMAAGTGAASAAPVDSAIPAGAYTAKIAAPSLTGISGPVVGELPASVSGTGVLTIAGQSGKLQPFHGGRLAADGARAVIAGVPVVVWTLPGDDAEGVYVVDVAGAANSGNLVRR